MPQPLAPAAAEAASMLSNRNHETVEQGDLLGPPPIITGEDPKEYAELLERLSADLMPKDFIEVALVRDVADHIWEIRRLRRTRAALLRGAAYLGLEKVVQPLVGWPESSDLATKWVQRDPETLKQVDQLLADAGLGMTEIMSEAFALNLPTLDTLDAMIERAEKRYAAASREIEHHREALAVPVRAIKAAEDAEFENVVPEASANGAAP